MLRNLFDTFMSNFAVRGVKYVVEIGGIYQSNKIFEFG